MFNVLFLTQYIDTPALPPSYPTEISLNSTEPVQNIPAYSLFWLSFAPVAVLALLWNCF